jgi:hypothetical protein
MIWVVVPLGRAEMIPNVLENVGRQALPLKLCLVENGQAVGACAERSVSPDLLLTSEHHQASAKNEAVAAIKKLGGGLISFWDDDDEYSAGFLGELLSQKNLATVVGKRRHLVRLRDGLYLFDRKSANALSSWLHGPTCLVRAEECVEFPRVAPNDDGEWCKAMAQAGATFWATSIWNYTYSRTGNNHVWQASDLLVRHMLGDAFRLDADCATFIPAPTDDEIIDALAAGLAEDRFDDQAAV